MTAACIALLACPIWFMTKDPHMKSHSSWHLIESKWRLNLSPVILRPTTVCMASAFFVGSIPIFIGTLWNIYMIVIGHLYRVSPHAFTMTTLPANWQFAMDDSPVADDLHRNNSNFHRHHCHAQFPLLHRASLLTLCKTIICPSFQSILAACG